MAKTCDLHSGEYLYMKWQFVCHNLGMTLRPFSSLTTVMTNLTLFSLANLQVVLDCFEAAILLVHPQNGTLLRYPSFSWPQFASGSNRPIWLDQYQTCVKRNNNILFFFSTTWSTSRSCVIMGIFISANRMDSGGSSQNE